jgi:hypothetical protein
MENMKSSKQEHNTNVALNNDFIGIIYDEHFKNAFSNKWLLAVIIKETIDLYSNYSVKEIAQIVGNVSASTVNVSLGF